MFQNKKLDRNQKREISRINKEKKLCAKLYSDWKDDEFNAGHNKYIFGVVSNNEQSDVASFNTLTDLDVMYNRQYKTYYLYVHNKICNDYKQYLKTLLRKFKHYVLKVVDAQTSGVNKFSSEMLKEYKFDDDLFSASTLFELYIKFAIYVRGYCALEFT